MNTADQLAVQKMLASVDTYRASDIHFSVGNPPMMRVGGKLLAVPDQPLMTPDFLEGIVFSWLDEHQQAQLREKKDILVTKTFDNKKRFKIAAFYQQGHVSATLTVVPHMVPGLHELGLPVEAQQLVNMQSGLVLVIGPYGSNQHLTIASFIEHLNRTAQKHIVTFEKPVEILFADQNSVIDQREIGRDVDSVEAGLEYALREDVDVIAVTEMTSPTAMQKVLQAPTAGKVVFGVMNSTSITSAITTLIHSVDGADQFQTRTELATNLMGVINQRIVTTRVGEKVMIAEVMIPNPAIRAVIQQGDLIQIANVMATNRGQAGMRLLDDALIQAVQQGIVSAEEVRRHASDPSLFQ